MLWLTALLACHAGGDDVSADSGVASSAGPRHPEPLLSVAEVEEGMKEAVRFGIPEPFSLVETYFELMSHGDEVCPGGAYAEGLLEVFDPAGCESETSGYQFEGVCGGGEMQCDDGDGDGLINACRTAISGDGHITDADGNVFLIGGTSLLEATGAPPEGGRYSYELFGVWGYPAAEALWLTQESSLGLTASGEFGVDGVTTMQFTGGFTVGGVTVDMAGLSFGGACGESPEGTLGLRDSAGYWYDLVYDAESCDGCGELTFDRRHPMGRACVDVADPFRMYRYVMSEKLLAAYRPESP